MSKIDYVKHLQDGAEVFLRVFIYLFTTVYKPEIQCTLTSNNWLNSGDFFWAATDRIWLHKKDGTVVDLDCYFEPGLQGLSLVNLSLTWNRNLKLTRPILVETYTSNTFFPEQKQWSLT